MDAYQQSKSSTPFWIAAIVMLLAGGAAFVYFLPDRIDTVRDPDSVKRFVAPGSMELDVPEKNVTYVVLHEHRSDFEGLTLDQDPAQVDISLTIRYEEIKKDEEVVADESGEPAGAEQAAREAAEAPEEPVADETAETEESAEADGAEAEEKPKGLDTMDIRGDERFLGYETETRTAVPLVFFSATKKTVGEDRKLIIEADLGGDEQADRPEHVVVAVALMNIPASIWQAGGLCAGSVFVAVVLAIFAILRSSRRRLNRAAQQSAQASAASSSEEAVTENQDEDER